MYVSQIMTTPAVTVEPDAPAEEVAKLLHENRTGSVIVEADTPLGIVTETDLVRLVAEEADTTGMTAADLMTTDLVTVDGFEDVEEAARLLKKNRIKKLPVVYGGALVGILTATDISHHLPKIIGGEALEKEELVDRLEGAK